MTFPVSARNLLPQAGVFIVLFLLGWWGHATHWTLPKFSAIWGSGHPPAVSPGATTIVSSGGELPVIVFDSLEGVRRSGISIAHVMRQDVEDVVSANAVIGYDRSRVAELAPRTVGRVAYLFKRLGDPVTEGEVLALLDSEEVGRAKAEFLQESAVAIYKAQVYSRLMAIGTDVVAEQTIRESEAAVREAKLKRFAAFQKLLNLGLSADLSENALLSPEEMARRLQFAGIPENVVSQLNPRPKTANLIPLIAPSSGVITKMETVVGEMERPTSRRLPWRT